MCSVAVPGTTVFRPSMETHCICEKHFRGLFCSSAQCGSYPERLADLKYNGHVQELGAEIHHDSGDHSDMLSVLGMQGLVDSDSFRV